MQKQIVDLQSPLSVSQGDTMKALLETHKISSLYRVLDVSANCTDAEIQSAITALKSSDLPLSAEHIYAVQILGNPEERRRYDAQLINRLSPATNIEQHEASKGGRYSSIKHNPATKPKRYRLLLVMLCLAFAGVGGWSYLRDPQALMKSAAATGTNTHKCTAITTKHYSEEQRRAAMERLKNRGWDVRPENMAYALDALEKGKPDAFETITDLLIAGVDLNLPNNAVSYPVLQLIWYDNHQTDSMLKLFLEHGANINNPYEPPLVSAAMAGNIEIAKYLIDHCANVNMRAAQGSPEGYVLAKGHTPITAALYESRKEKDAQRKLALARLFLDHGADVNQPGLLNMTPVHEASSKDLDILKLIVERGAKLDNQWILFAAINTGREENAAYLIQKGANLNYKGENGKTLLALARANGMSRVATLLQEKGIQN